MVTEAAASGMQEHGDTSLGEAECVCGLLVEYVSDPANFAEVVSGAQGAELRKAAFFGALGHGAGVCPTHGSSFLGDIEVRGSSESGRDGPSGALNQHGFEFLVGKSPVAFRADAGRHGAQKFRGKRRKMGLHVLERDPGSKEAHAAVDIVANSSWGNDSVVLIESGDATDGETISPMDIGHGQGVVDDAWQMGDMGDLIEARVFADISHHGFGGEYQAGHSHLSLAWNPNTDVVDTLNADSRAHGGGQGGSLAPWESVTKVNPTIAVVVRQCEGSYKMARGTRLTVRDGSWASGGRNSIVAGDAVLGRIGNRGKGEAIIEPWHAFVSGLILNRIVTLGIPTCAGV